MLYLLIEMRWVLVVVAVIALLTGYFARQSRD